MSTENATKPEGVNPKSNRRVVIGIVTRDKMDKTRRVEIPYVVKHSRYKKYVKRRTVCYVHDENNESAMGDTVEIVESRPLSKLKNWTMVRIVKKAPMTMAEAKKQQAEKAAETKDSEQ